MTLAVAPPPAATPSTADPAGALSYAPALVWLQQQGIDGDDPRWVRLIGAVQAARYPELAAIVVAGRGMRAQLLAAAARGTLPLLYAAWAHGGTA